MTLTSSQFQFVKENYGSIGLFLIIVCWEHVMILVKYIMHSTIAPLPDSVATALRKEQQQRKDQRSIIMREKNARRSNCHVKHTSKRKPLADNKDLCNNTNTSHRKKCTNKGKENIPLLPRDNSDMHFQTPARSPTKTQTLRQRKGSHISSNKKKATTTPLHNKTPCSEPLTPKRSSGVAMSHYRNGATSSSEELSPFALYFQSNQSSPLASHTTSHYNNSSESDSLSELLSPISGIHNKDDNNNDKRKTRPSMSRALYERESLEAQKAAKKRIQKRYSDTGEMRRKNNREVI